VERRRGERKKLAAYIVMAAFTAGSVGYTAKVSQDQSQSARDFATRLSAQIQAERRRTILSSCEHTNAANAATKHRARLIPKGPQRDFTFSLIDTLAPTQNCAALVAKRVQGPLKP
jgi:hypothetical protein